MNNKTINSEEWVAKKNAERNNEYSPEYHVLTDNQGDEIDHLIENEVETE